MRNTILFVHDPLDGEFVHAFADRLRSRGYDTDTEHWAMQREESLVDKIFGSGLRTASLFLIAISRISEPQQWLRSELDSTNVARIQRHVPVVTLLLDDRMVPSSLSGTVVEAVQDRLQFEGAAALVADMAYRSMYPDGARSFDENLAVIEGLNRLQSALLMTACDYLMDREGDTVQPDRALPADKWGWLSEDELLSNLAEIEDKGLLKVFRFLTGGFHFGPTRAGFEAYLKTYRTDYQEILKAFAGAIINQGLSVNTEIARQLNLPQRLINHIIDVLEERKMLKTTRFIDSVKVQNASSALRSLLWFQADAAGGDKSAKQGTAAKPRP